MVVVVVGSDGGGSCKLRFIYILLLARTSYYRRKGKEGSGVERLRGE